MSSRSAAEGSASRPATDAHGYPLTSTRFGTQPPQKQSLPGRHGQPPVSNPLQHTYRQVAARPVTNATLAVRATTGTTAPNSSKAGQAGQIKPMRDMLYIKFTEQTHAPADPNNPTKPRTGPDPGLLMKLVSRNTKNGAQFTPQGVLRWPLTSPKAKDVLAETKALLIRLIDSSL